MMNHSNSTDSYTYSYENGLSKSITFRHFALLYHVYTYMHLSSSIKLGPFYKLHLVLLEEHCATSCLVMAGCGALLSHNKKRTTPMCHVEEHCYKWNLHKMTFWILVQNHYSDLLWSFDISGCPGVVVSKDTMESAKGCFGWLHLLPTSTFSHMPTVQPLTHLWTYELTPCLAVAFQVDNMSAWGQPAILRWFRIIPCDGIPNHPNSGIQKSFPYHCVSHIQHLPGIKYWLGSPYYARHATSPTCVCGFSPPQLLQLRSGTKHRNVKGITIFFQWIQPHSGWWFWTNPSDKCEGQNGMISPNGDENKNIFETTTITVT